jgi:predicted nucleotidyltransferase
MLSLKEQHIILEITAKYDPTYVGLFGSYSRNEEQPESDIDILIDFKDNLDLLTIIGIEQELEELLGKKVDLITYKSLNKLLKPFIENDLIPLIQ